MKNYMLFLLLLMGCTEKDSPEPSEYLLVEEVHRLGWLNPVFTTTTYTYDASGTVTAMKVNEDQINFKVYPERFSSAELPSIEAINSEGVVHAYFTDASGLVSRSKSKSGEYWYTYDDQNRMVEKISHTEEGKFTLNITYDFMTGVEITDIHALKGEDWIGPRRDRYYYSSEAEETPAPNYPFHYGRSRGHKLVRIYEGCVYICSPMEFFHSYVRDGEGRISRVEMLLEYQGFKSSVTYRYAAK